MVTIYNWLIENIDFIGLCVDIVALVVGVILTIGIYKLERRHEKDREKSEEKAQKKAVIEAAKIFMIDNDEELEYLPLATIAARLNLKRKHCRDLTTRFMRCNEQHQKEILRQANVKESYFSMKDVDVALEALKKDLTKNSFGKNILYDGAKYLHRAFERWAHCPIKDVNPYIFEDIKASERHGDKSSIVWRIANCNTTLYSYMWDYLHADETEIDKGQIAPPIDMVFRNCNLGSCDEDIMTFWTMRIIVDTCHVLKEHKFEDELDESLIQTQEDMYYYTLSVLCKAYSIKDEDYD